MPGREIGTEFNQPALEIFTNDCDNLRMSRECCINLKKLFTAKTELGREHRGTWRSLVARLTGGQEVAGSNPVVPTKRKSCRSKELLLIDGR